MEYHTNSVFGELEMELAATNIGNLVYCAVDPMEVLKEVSFGNNTLFNQYSGYMETTYSAYDREFTQIGDNAMLPIPITTPSAPSGSWQQTPYICRIFSTGGRIEFLRSNIYAFQIKSEDKEAIRQMALERPFYWPATQTGVHVLSQRPIYAGLKYATSEQLRNCCS